MAKRTQRPSTAGGAGNHRRLREDARQTSQRERSRAGRRAASSQNGRKKAASGKGRRKKKRMSFGTRLLVTICVILLLGVLTAIGVLASKMSKLEMVTLDPDKLSISDELTYDETGYLNVALFGLDTRENNDEMGSRSDTIIIASLNRETKELKLASVYRDTLLQQDDGTYNKANAAYNFGGAEEAIAMLNRNLDMDIQHYVTVDFSALVDVIDALGGIEIDVTEEEIPYINGYAVEIIENTGVDTWAVTEPGLQNLTGVQATAYARIRYTEGDDYKRAERQRTVLAKIAEKAQGASLTTLSQIIDKVFPKVETNFNLTEILAYAKDVKKYTLGETVGFPFDKSTMIYENAGDSVIPLNLVDNVRQLHEYLFSADEDYTYSPSSTVQAISDEIEYLTGMGSSYDSGTYSGDSYDYSTYGDTGTYDSGTYDYSGYDSGTYDSAAYDSGTYDSGTGDTGTYGSGTYDSGSGNSGTYGDGAYNDGYGDTGTGY